MHPQPQQRRPPQAVAKLFLLDVSYSMNEQNKMAMLKTVLIDLVESGKYFAQDLLALSTFSSGYLPLVAFTPVRQIGPFWASAVRAMQPSGCTMMGDALYKAIGAMGGAAGYRKKIVLLSDGKPTTSNGMPTPEARAEVVQRSDAARRYRIRIDTIGFGTASEIDLPLLQTLAQRTGGSFMYANSLSELAGAFRAA